MAEAISATETADAQQDLIALAHAQLLEEPGLQFDFPEFVAPEPPAWWAAVLEFLSALSPLLSVLFWAALALGVAALLFVIANAVISRRAESGEAAAVPDPIRGEGWRPPEAKARALLGDADALAAQGRFAEAVHLLLYRSIDDILHWQPEIVKPALTSRELAALDALPAQARAAFSGIAGSVERSFFGGRDVDASEFESCRRAYAAFALPRAGI